MTDCVLGGESAVCLLFSELTKWRLGIWDQKKDESGGKSPGLKSIRALPDAYVERLVELPALSGLAEDLSQKPLGSHSLFWETHV